jgi:hypothetical protein
LPEENDSDDKDKEKEMDKIEEKEIDKSEEKEKGTDTDKKKEKTKTDTKKKKCKEGEKCGTEAKATEIKVRKFPLSYRDCRAKCSSYQFCEGYEYFEDNPDKEKCKIWWTKVKGLGEKLANGQECVLKDFNQLKIYQ